MSTTCTLKGGCLSIATQGSYWLSSPHPLALTTASRPGIPATAETRSRAGTRGHRVERGAKTRGKGGREDLAKRFRFYRRADPTTHQERSPTLEISHHPKAPATVAPPTHLTQFRASDAALLSHRATAACAPKGTS